MVKKIKMVLFCLVISWLTFPALSLCAEEEIDDSETFLLAENIEEFLENLEIDSKDERKSRAYSSELYKGERIGKHYLNGQFISYITKMYVDGQLAYCLEPMVLIPGGVGSTISGYEASGVLSYDRLDYSTKVKIWKIAYYGYGYDGHYENDRFAATQCLIWEAVNEPQEAYTMFDEPWDLSAVKSDIMTLVETNPAGKVPSFAGDTIKLSVNKATLLTDENQVLPNYAVPEVKNIGVNQNGNELTLTLSDSSDFASSLNASGSVYNALLQSVIWKNADYQIMFTQHYEPMKDFSLFFELDTVPFTITKLDRQNGQKAQGEATLNGAVISIKDALTQDEILQLKMNDSNTITYEDLPVGDYIACEIIAPKGYILDPQCVPFSTKSKEAASVEIFNEVIKGQIAITKFIIGNEELKENRKSGVVTAGKGFSFDIISLSNNEIVDTLVTDENGNALSKMLPYGRYKIREQDRDGFETAREFEVKISEQGKVYSYIVENDVFEAELTIFKVDKETKKRVALSGAEFKIKDAEGKFITQMVTYPQKEQIDTFITDETGSIHLPSSLSYGTYTICEIHAPYGYILNDEELEFQVDGTRKEINIEFEDQSAKGTLIIKKTGEIPVGFEKIETPFGDVAVLQFEKGLLDGVTYRILAREDIITPDQTLWFHANEIVEEITTHANEPVVSSKLPLGSYSVQEIRTKSGYVRDDQSYDFDLTYENETVEIVTYTFDHINERKKGILHFNKVFEPSLFNEENKREGIVFGLFNADDILIDDVLLPKGSMLGYSYLNQDSSGQFEVDLPGHYVIKEIQTSVGYELNETEYPITVDFAESDEEVIHYHLDQDILNIAKKGSLILIKQDPFGKNFTGSTFEISSTEDFGNILYTIQTDENGEIYLTDIPIGTYYLRESDCLDFFELNPSVVEIEILANETVEIVFENRYRNVGLQIVKVNEKEERLNEAEFVLVDITDKKEQEIYFLTLGTERELNEFFSQNTRLISSDESVLSTSKTMVHAKKEGEVFLSAVDEKGNLREIILIKTVNYDKGGQSFWMERCKIDEGDLILPDLNDKIIFKGRTGHEYLRLIDPNEDQLPILNQQVSFYANVDDPMPTTVKVTNEFGMIELDDLETGKWFYRLSTDQKMHDIEVVKSKGELSVQNLKWGRTYLLIETALPWGMTYESSPVTKVECTLDSDQDTQQITVYNRTRKVSLKVIKMDEGQKKRLNGADFIIKDTEKDQVLDEKISGALFLKDDSDRYFLARDEEMSEIISIIEPNEFNEIFMMLPEGIYYLQKMGEMKAEIQKIEIEKGALIFDDLEINKEYLLYEMEAPAGYIKNEEEIRVNLDPDFLCDQVEMIITNSEIQIPNMSDR